MAARLRPGRGFPAVEHLFVVLSESDCETSAFSWSFLFPHLLAPFEIDNSQSAFPIASITYSDCNLKAKICEASKILASDFDPAGLEESNELRNLVEARLRQIDGLWMGVKAKPNILRFDRLDP